MKNIHVLTTDKPDFVIFKNRHLGDRLFHWNMDLGNPMNRLNYVGQNIYITSDEEIKEGDWCLLNNRLVVRYFKPPVESKSFKNIILTTDQDLIKNGVQAIDDEFLEWFVENPSCESVDIETMIECEKCGKEHCDNLQCRGYKDIPYYKIMIPKEEPKQDLEKEMFELEQELDIPSHLRWHNSKPKQETTLEEAAENYTEFWLQNKGLLIKDAFIAGAKWQQEQILDFLYSEITERRDYSASKMCEKVIEFIEQFKNK